MLMISAYEQFKFYHFELYKTGWVNKLDVVFIDHGEAI